MLNSACDLLSVKLYPLWIHLFTSITLGASLVPQIVKNLPAMQETWVQSLGWEDPLKKGMAAHSNILVHSNPMDRGAW